MHPHRPELKGAPRKAVASHRSCCRSIPRCPGRGVAAAETGGSSLRSRRAGTSIAFSEADGKRRLGREAGSAGRLRRGAGHPPGLPGFCRVISGKRPESARVRHRSTLLCVHLGKSIIKFTCLIRAGMKGETRALIRPFLRAAKAAGAGSAPHRAAAAGLGQMAGLGLSRPRRAAPPGLTDRQ